MSFVLNLTTLIKLITLLAQFSGLAKADFLIDQRFKEENRIHPPVDPFFNTFYDKSYYLYGSQRPVYHVDVNTVYGRVRGTSYQVGTDQSFYQYPYYYYVSAFLGIPYAVPPTGENRFQV